MGRLDRLAAVQPQQWLPDKVAAICLQCRAIFHASEDRCPACGSADTQRLPDWIDGKTKPRIIRKGRDA
mgnify:FL=1